jgi:two-component system, cell cycle response regulator DivK
MQPGEANVFVVEDSSDNLFVIQTLLRDAGVRWQNARASGSMFFKWLNTSDLVHLNEGFHLHLILLDIQIPREDGYTILKQMREHPALQQTLIIAVTANVLLTANVLPTDVARARAAGFNGFIGKPLDRHRFPDQIRRVLEGEPVWEPI